jgi:CRP-like cAMP-binding protein
VESLFNYINRYITTPISESDFKNISSHLVYKKIRKKQYFLAEGEVCKYFAFIVKGAMRKYYVDENGKENIVNLYIENWWAGDRESFIMLTTTNYYIDAWEDCEVLLITKASMLQLNSESPAFNEMMLKMDERNNIANQKRITSTISFCAEKRYLDFITTHPQFLQRFPQHIIASYLGVTKDTLSRIRKQHLSK